MKALEIISTKLSQKIHHAFHLALWF